MSAGHFPELIYPRLPGRSVSTRQRPDPSAKRPGLFGLDLRAGKHGIHGIRQIARLDGSRVGIVVEAALITEHALLVDEDERWRVAHSEELRHLAFLVIE